MPSISLTNPTNITRLEFTPISSEKLGGTIDVSAFANLQKLVIGDHNLTEVEGYANNPNIQHLQLNGNVLSTPLPSLTEMSSLQRIYFNGNEIIGSFPDITGLSNLIAINVGNNQMTGTLPSDFGTLGLTRLDRFNVYDNNFSGTLPSFSGTTVQWVLCNNNNLSDFTGGVPISLYKFEAINNNLTQTAVDNILQAFVDANRQTPTNDMSQASINLSGTGNSAPSSQANAITLASRGWTVTTN